eukprot:CAMPEP_0206428854 /NCGR_PEP_ID=MMETSP0324_2-20121206/5905_1 /ASSEMBLY_ACC=CAM_ASM_000836 /TAXON_ID=2866 /ORGANISM="Crypthecodinium cohnii, Strain Seligo" /LENGTH=116 /DNA_ID=CAMNT_0053894447 /DNA_START=1065 /DNA_END=1415 /DNA_ORIENTATION=-
MAQESVAESPNGQSAITATSSSFSNLPGSSFHVCFGKVPSPHRIRGSEVAEGVKPILDPIQHEDQENEAISLSFCVPTEAVDVASLDTGLLLSFLDANRGNGDEDCQPQHEESQLN